ncbi:MAG: reverse gyrase [Acidilobaceae archaeon]
MRIQRIRGIYRGSCPNCGGSISSDRLEMGLPCDKCLPRLPDGSILKEDIFHILEKSGSLKNYRYVYELESEAREFIKFFEKTLGSPPWGAQRTWIKRLVRGDSFSIVAPTGTGKTTFGIVAALYLACVKKAKSYILVPTTTLVAQIVEKANTLAKNIGCTPIVVGFHSKMKRSERENALNMIMSGGFDILVSTIAFARRYADILSNYKFKFVLVDDVDAVLKSGRSIDAVLKIVGFSRDHLEKATKLLSLQREIARILESASEEEFREKSSIKSKLANIQNDIEAYKRELLEMRGKVAQVIFSSATGRPRGSRVRLFRALLGFEVGGRGDIGLRNIVDTYYKPTIGDINDIDGFTGEIVDLIKKLGSGTLVYVPMDMGVDVAEKIAKILEERGIKAKAYHAKTPFSVFEAFINGELDVLVGVANYYGALVRGIDLPERVKHAVFIGVPRFKFPVTVGEPHPANLMRLLSLLVDIDIEDVARQARGYLAEVRRIVKRYSPAYLQYLTEKILEGEIEGENRTLRVLIEAYKFLLNALSDKDVWDRLRDRSDIATIEYNGLKYILLPDISTYIQASGRTSRLYAGGITKGLSIVIVDNEKVFNGLKTKAKYIADIKWVELKRENGKYTCRDIDLDSLLDEIRRDRERVSSILRGVVKHIELVKSALLLVESPNKARTIASFFGQPTIRVFPGGLRAYEVALQNYILTIAASGGHVFELVSRTRDDDIQGELSEYKREDVFGVIVVTYNGKKHYIPVLSSIKRCLSCGYQYTDESEQCPRCGSKSIRDSRDIIEDIRRIAWEVDEVFIGTDPDTEGEKIGWDLALQIKPYNSNIYRVEFHEVTKDEILKAISSPRTLNEKLVEAQIVRRVEDRWIGFTLSPLLWCDFWFRYCDELQGMEKAGYRVPVRDLERCYRDKYNFNLSAGRVQTPILGWVVKRDSEKPKTIRVYDLTLNGEIILSLKESDISSELASILKGYAKKTKKREPVELEIIVDLESRREDTINPPPPYTTDTMIADASRYLNLGAPETMRLAQDLFEWGLITYHRTDSTRVSERGMQIAFEWLQERFRDNAEKLYKPRKWGEGGAHEAIRPVKPIDADTLQSLLEEGIIELPGRITRKHIMLYSLIFERFIASQMREAIVHYDNYNIYIVGVRVSEKRMVKIGVDNDIVSKGFTLVWSRGIQVQKQLAQGPINVRVNSRKAMRVYPYTQGSLVEEMKNRGIGRPSTYAKIVETLLKRKYIALLKKTKGYIVSTVRGRRVYKYLTMDLKDPESSLKVDYGDLKVYLERVPRLVSEDRTRDLERLMDEIERGEKEWSEVLDSIYSETRELSLPIRLISLEEFGVVPSVAKRFRECLEMAKSIFGTI